MNAMKMPINVCVSVCVLECAHMLSHTHLLGREIASFYLVLTEFHDSKEVNNSQATHSL